MRRRPRQKKGVATMLQLIHNHKEYFMGLLFMVILVILCHAGFRGLVAHGASVNESLKAELAEKQAAYEEAVSDVAYKQASYEASLVRDDYDRVTADNTLMDNFFRDVMTWGSYEGYNAARSAAMSTYKVPEDSVFMKSFMPEQVEAGPTSDGSMYNQIDLYKLNVRYESMESHVTAIDPVTDVYTYFTVVTWSTLDKYGNEGMSHAAFTYQIDKEGNISDLDGYTLVR